SVTAAPAGPVAGARLAIPGSTVYLTALVAVPAGVVTATKPVVASAGTVAVILVAETTAYVAGVPLNATTVAPVKFAPFTVTVAPAGPAVGEKPVIAGEVTAKLVALVPVPSEPWTLSLPVVALAGTVAVICVAEST